jgi:hypothetical protein
LFLGWSLGLSLFLELLLAPAMLQGSHFLLLVHLSCVKSRLLELFYHNDKKIGAGTSPALQINVEEFDPF